MPGKEDAWAFVWKSLRHLREGGIVAFLLPAMAFLHNHAKAAVSARKRLVQDVRIFRIINFADLRFQLFEGAVRPAAWFIFGRSDQEAPAVSAVPKVHENGRSGSAGDLLASSSISL